MGSYIKSRFPDWLLCTLMSGALSSAICSGFEMDSPDSSSIIPIFILAACVSIVMLMLSYRRLLTGLGIAAGALLAVGSVVYIKGAHLLTNEADHAEFIFVLVGIIAGVLVFLLSRSRAGTVFLFIGGNIIGAGAHFLQFENPLWSFIIFTAAVLMMFMYRVYMVSLMRADMGRVRTMKYMRQTVAFCLAALLLASGIFAGIVRPLDPPVQDLKLIRILKQMDMLEVLGIYSVKTVLNPFLNSEAEPETTDFSDQQGEEDSDAIDDQNDQEQNEENDNSLVDKNNQIKVDAIKYIFKEYHIGLLIIPLIILIIAAAAAFVVTRRRRWRREVQALSNEEVILNYFNYFLRCLAISGIKKPVQKTLAEFSESAAHDLEMFDTDGIRFEELSGIYERVVYGRLKADDEELKLYERYFDGFSKGLKKRMGRFKYYLNFIRL